MDLYSGTVSPSMFVKALYDYHADDQTSLSFRQGDIIQVLNQLESGWWDGMINGVRGWFPSNFCVLLSPEDVRRMESEDQVENDPETDDEFDYQKSEQEYQQSSSNATLAPGDSKGAAGEQEEAAFWIPQATPEGRLYYFNTLTGDTARELPLESPTSANETVPRNFSTDVAARRLRPAPEILSRGVENDEVTDFDQSASETEEPPKSGGSSSRRRRSDLSEGASPATSMESLSMEPTLPLSTAELAKHKSGSAGRRSEISSAAGSKASCASTSSITGAPMPQRFFEDPNSVKLTWNRILDDMRSSIERYRSAINNAERADFVRRAEDVSDHLRLIIAAATGTTDNPSIMSSNKLLYQRYREMMSKFSRLNLTTQMATKDWAAGDLYPKCLQEADGVLLGVQKYVEVARKQRGEEVPRVFPGFVLGYKSGANWQNNGLYPTDNINTLLFTDQDEYETKMQPNEQLDIGMLEKIKLFGVSIRSSFRHFERILALDDKMLAPLKQESISKEISLKCGVVLQSITTWSAALESLDLSHLREFADDTQLNDFALRKQTVYNKVGEIVINCQELAAPLADEWAQNRGMPFKERLERLRTTAKELEGAISQVEEALRAIMTLPQDERRPSGDSVATGPTSGHQPSVSVSSTRSLLGDISSAVTVNSSNIALEVAANAERSKVQQMFGEVPQVEAPRERDENVPDYLQLDHELEVVYDRKTDPPTIRGGTFAGLVEQLTRHDKHDSNFLNTFLLTYQSFTTASELFEMLAQRWNIQPPNGLSSADYKIWAMRKQDPIRFRVVNVLKTWVDTYWLEGNDAAGKALLQKLYAFAKNTVATSSTPRALPLGAVIEQRIRGEDPNPKRMVSNASGSAPAPILPKNLKKLRMGDKVTDIDPREFARQLTIIESRLYCKIKRHECLNKVWNAPVPTNNEVHPAANVKALILNSNRLTNWVAESILAQPDVKKRVAVIKHFISVAEHCLNMSNFSTLTAIVSAFGTSPVDRLQRTWKEVPQKSMNVLEKLRSLMHNSRNFAEYREALHRSNPPCLPFFGVYLTDLTFIEDGIPSRLKRPDLINFAKRTKIAEVVREIQTYQNAAYSLTSVSELQDYILSSMQAALHVNDLYNKSLLVEPRERDHEKIERLLTEQGFL